MYEKYSSTSIGHGHIGFEISQHTGRDYGVDLFHSHVNRCLSAARAVGHYYTELSRVLFQLVL